jgi:hypothetical protein
MTNAARYIGKPGKLVTEESSAWTHSFHRAQGRNTEDEIRGVARVETLNLRSRPDTISGNIEERLRQRMHALTFSKAAQKSPSEARYG